MKTPQYKRYDTEAPLKEVHSNEKLEKKNCRSAEKTNIRRSTNVMTPTLHLGVVSQVNECGHVA